MEKQQNGNKQPRKPRFNFTWLYILLIAAIGFVVLTRGTSYTSGATR